MSCAGIGAALLSDVPQNDRLPAFDCARILNGIAERNPGKMFGLATIDPTDYTSGTVTDIGRQLPGIVGIRINSGRCGVALDDLKMLDPIISELLETGMPLFAEVTASAFDLTHPFRLEKLLAARPELRVAAIHMGGASRPDFCKDVFSVARRHDNLWLIGSANYWQRVLQAINEVGSERVMFGSASPEKCFMVSAVAAYKAMFAVENLPESVCENVLSVNLKRFIEKKC